MLKEFRDFLFRGNVVDLAVAVIIGAAFSQIVNSLVADIFTPIIGALLGGVDFSAMAITIGNAQIMYGNFLNAVINFLIVGWILFMILKAYNRFRTQTPPAPAAPTEEVVLLREIRDSLQRRE